MRPQVALALSHPELVVEHEGDDFFAEVETSGADLVAMTPYLNEPPGVGDDRVGSGLLADDDRHLGSSVFSPSLRDSNELLKHERLRLLEEQSRHG